MAAPRALESRPLRRPSDEIGHWTFLTAHTGVMGETIGREGPAFAKARALVFQWAATIHYLIGRVKADVEEANKTRTEPIMAPLLEAPTSSYASILLATSGYYREAIAVLRPLSDLVLWQWCVQAQALSERQLRPLRGKKGKAFDDKYLDRLFQRERSKIQRYSTVITNRVRNAAARHRLLEPVNKSTVKQFRRELHAAVHGQPEVWNIMRYPKLVPLPEFIGSNGVDAWLKTFERLHRYVAVWCLLMFPNLMAWSVRTPLEEQYGPGNHDVWWNPVLEPIQKQFFMRLDRT